MAGGGRVGERRKGRTASPSLTEMLWGAGVWLEALGWAVNRGARGGPWPWRGAPPGAGPAAWCEAANAKPEDLIWVCVEQRWRYTLYPSYYVSERSYSHATCTGIKL